jgi:hypothetical protein
MSHLNQTVNGASMREIKEGEKLYSTHYTPELWTIRKDYIYAAQAALVNAIEYIKECQATHEANLGETTLKNRLWANRMRDDLLKAEQALDNIQRPEGAQP